MVLLLSQPYGNGFYGVDKHIRVFVALEQCISPGLLKQFLCHIRTLPLVLSSTGADLLQGGDCAEGLP